MSVGESMEKNLPGCLYAKSLLADDPPGAEFQWLFLHRDIKPFVSKIDALRTAFSWESGGTQAHVPVVIVETATSDSSLLVRFSDAGKDKFGRDGTIRLEAMLVPSGDVPALVDGTFSASPKKDDEVFLVRVSDSPQGRLPQGAVGVFGRPGTFRLKSVGIVPQAHSLTEPQPDLRRCVDSVGRRKILRAYLATAVSGLIAVVAMMIAIHLAGTPDESKEELKETRRKVMELETTLAKQKADMSVQRKLFDDYLAQLKDLLNKAP